MVESAAEQAIRSYMIALKDPASLRDDERLAQLQEDLAQADDELERLRLRQEIEDAQQPSVESFQDAFVTHAKAWADEHGIGAKAFAAEGVDNATLRRAGFSVRGRGRSARASSGTRRKRVTTEEVQARVPDGPFTVKQLQELSGASAAVVRKAINLEIASGTVTDQGTDPDHTGPGRAPTLYVKR